ncbi:MAG: phosphatidate cytidylyltransferase [Candidatus Coatesbacteria bacterium]|nr:phosphatidate cytidylyltransferase [Candidatus Coatesbacteria bacterium]
MTQIKTRVITAVIFGAVVLSIIILCGDVGLRFLVLFVVLCGLHELQSMLKASGIEVYWLLIGALSCAFAFLSIDVEVMPLILLISILVVLLRGLLSRREPPTVLTQVAFSIFAIMFLPLLASFIVCLGAIRSRTQCGAMPLGLELVLLLLLATWACDIAAYFCGRRWGKHKALERISPNKTLEGFAAGVCASTLTSTVVCLMLFREVSITQAAVLGLLLGAFGQLGDLCMSLIKRATGRKDAGTLLPGHGGILDRTDSLLFNAPVMYVFVTAVLDRAL